MQIVDLFGIGTFLMPLPWAAVLGAGVIGSCCAFPLIVTLALPPQIVSTGDVHRLDLPAEIRSRPDVRLGGF